MSQLIAADKEKRNDINLTPMLDVATILLILFVVTASFIRDFGLDVTRRSGLEFGLNET